MKKKILILFIALIISLLLIFINKEKFKQQTKCEDILVKKISNFWGKTKNECYKLQNYKMLNIIVILLL